MGEQKIAYPPAGPGRRFRQTRALARRLLKKHARALKQKENGGKTPDALWFTDHLPRFLSALKAARRPRDLQKAEAAALWEHCLRFLEEKKLPEEPVLAAFFAPLGLSLPACAALPAFLAAAAAAKAALGFSPSRKTEGAAAFGARFLSALEQLDVAALPALLSETERLLLRDPAGVYPRLSPETKAAYRAALLRLARAAGYSEGAAARGVLAACEKADGGRDHVGSFLPLHKKYPAALFFAAEHLTAAAASAFASLFCVLGANGIAASAPPAGQLLCCAGLWFLFYLLLSAVFRPFWDLLAAKCVRPRFLPRLDEEDPSVPLPQTMIALCTLLPPADKAEALYDRLETLAGAAGVAGTTVALLADLPAGAAQTAPADAADIAAAKDVITRLNRARGGGFALFLRSRVYAPTEDAFAGDERKRGAIEALAKTLGDGKSRFAVAHGDLENLKKTAYLLVLDADTGLQPGALRRLLCTAAHPLNRAVIENGRVIAGYGCFAPRTGVAPEAAGKTVFSRLFAGSDVSIYTPRVSERYMDLCGQGLFCGKGLIDLEAYRAVCADALPRGVVLSHDMPEGALLSTAFVSDAALTEDFPARPAAWLRRTHRWLRGDIQNLRFVFFPAKKDAPETALPPLAKYQLLENLRRALSPPAAALALLLAAFLPQLRPILLPAAVLGVTAPALFSLGRALVHSLLSFFFRRFFSPAPAALGRLFLQPVLQLGVLPAVAAAHGDAVCRAAYRSLISRKKTLEWTTAAQSEGRRDRAAGFTAVFPLLFSAALLPGGAAFFPLAALFTLSVPFLFSSGKNTKIRKRDLTDAGRETLRHYAAAAFRYFDRYVSAATHYLPPDNVQETPVFRVANRTSPTNIGLYLASLLAAADLRLITPETLGRRVAQTAETLERLPKYRGLLYNWYDLQTLEPLPPAFVSSVDCGNYLACLAALRAGLREYAPLLPGAEALIARIRRLETEGDLACLYNRRRRLFAVGLDAETGRQTEAVYLHYMSEARLTSFYAVAKQIIPLSHWGALERTLFRNGAAASFSGTAFEYLTPSLFLPALPGTYEARGVARCLRAQKAYAKKRRAPMGVSESGCYAFDGDLNYLYKAHGLRSLAAASRPFAEPVFAPYAAFLSLSADPPAAMRALAGFAALSAFGSCGFYEAVDFTGRAAPFRFRVVRSFMAHHVGMSILAAANALRDDCFVRRFLADPDLRAAKGLLQEAPPATISPRKKTKEQKSRRPQRPSRAEKNEARPLGVYSDGEGTLLCDRRGGCRYLYAGTELLNFSARSRGVFAAVERNGAVTPLTGTRAFTLKEKSAAMQTAVGRIKLDCALALAAGGGALALPLRAENTGKTAAAVSLLWYFEPGFFPALTPPSHPAFADLRLRADYLAVDRALTFSRRGPDDAGPVLCVGFQDASPLLFCCDRETVLGSDPCRAHPFADGLPAFSNDTRFVRPALALRCPLRLAPGERATKILLLVPGADKDAALGQLLALRRRAPTAKTAAKDLFLRRTFCAQAIATLLLSAFFAADAGIRPAEGGGLAAGPQALWAAGISGDLPILRAKTDALPPAAVEDLLRAHALLAAAGIPFDLALCTEAPGVYGEDVPGQLRAAMGAAGLSGFGGRGGRHLIRLQRCTPAFLAALAAAPGADFPSPVGDFSEAPANREASAPPERAKPLFPKENHFVPGGYYIGLPTPRPWSHVLANRSFGTLLTNASLGFTWALNARLNPITPWSNDPCSHLTGERLLLHLGETVYDCAAGAAVYFYDDSAVYGAVCGKARLRLTVRVDAVSMKKEVAVDYTLPPGETAALTYVVTPQLCENPFHAAYVRAKPTENGVIFGNGANVSFPGRALLCCDVPASPQIVGNTLRLTANTREEKGALTFSLLFSAKEGGLAALQKLPLRRQAPPRFHPRTGNPALDRFAGALLLHQTLAVRLLARTGFYQNSGAYGFRDQLQDAMHLAFIAPALCKTQLFRCAAAQFPAGDVLHWFHPLPAPAPRKLGVRTRCADDRLWLPLAAAVYTEESGDDGALDTQIPFLAGEPLKNGERERCGEYDQSKEKASLYEHCMRAIRRTAENVGAHGLCLLLGGDWNDGLSEAGLKGKGESVWLTMFLKYVCGRFAKTALRRGKRGDASFLLSTADAANRAVTAAGWNGAYFRRGYTDDGAPLGDPGADACAMDLTVQAWGTLANAGTEEQRTAALHAACETLLQGEPPLLRLLRPPFGPHTLRAGYINDYPPGVRENGGQYTHAAVWFLMALQKAGMKEEEQAVLKAILPPTEEEALRQYKNEPYALSADVSAAPFFPGRGGWSLYTGAAGWLLRYVREWQRNGDKTAERRD